MEYIIKFNVKYALLTTVLEAIWIERTGKTDNRVGTAPNIYYGDKETQTNAMLRHSGRL